MVQQGFVWFVAQTRPDQPTALVALLVPLWVAGQSARLDCRPVWAVAHENADLTKGQDELRNLLGRLHNGL